MKARVKATGEIVDVRIDYKQDADYIAQNGQLYWQRELDFNNLNIKDEEITNTPDYWTRLEHQAAIAAMGGMCGNTSYNESSWESMAEDAIWAAHILVEKMKQEREG